MIRRIDPLDAPDPRAVDPGSADQTTLMVDGTAEETPPFRPELESFAGPLDLLLYLIQKNEVDIFDIPVAAILEQYLGHVRWLESADQLDLLLAGEYLVMASRLMEIKSRMLLPTHVDAGDDEPLEEELTDPRLSLVQQLLEYQEIKEKAVLLEGAHQRRQSRFDRLQHAEIPDPEAKLHLGKSTMWDLCAAFQRVVSDLLRREADVQVVEMEEVPIEEVIQAIAGILESRPDRRVGFRQILTQAAGDRELSLIILIGNFLAILEMARLRLVLISQDSQFGEIELRWCGAS